MLTVSALPRKQWRRIYPDRGDIAVQSTGMATDAVILEAVDMTEIVSKAGTALGSYSKPGG